MRKLLEPVGVVSREPERVTAVGFAALRQEREQDNAAAPDPERRHRRLASKMAGPAEVPQQQEQERTRGRGR